MDSSYCYSAMPIVYGTVWLCWTTFSSARLLLCAIIRVAADYCFAAAVKSSKLDNSAGRSSHSSIGLQGGCPSGHKDISSFVAITAATRLFAAIKERLLKFPSGEGGHCATSVAAADCYCNVLKHALVLNSSPQEKFNSAVGTGRGNSLRGVPRVVIQIIYPQSHHNLISTCSKPLGITADKIFASKLVLVAGLDDLVGDNGSSAATEGTATGETSSLRVRLSSFQSGFVSSRGFRTLKSD
ncbi:hypothetical protein RHMOL_Rhmol10G0153400 [Rhododendron molle]|uniref:Uncharacterized protein n=1 Tax=Rhododendron molle TaxID=49168 RepID=A0ACC0M497_RHOML|nr:hypothetical protein RHMOL_Rhmol10G0153400 [Rhododendron molle]